MVRVETTEAQWFQVADLWACYDGRSVLQGVSFALQPGQVLAVLGPSGTGKTTLLKAVAGIPDVTITAGRFMAGGTDLTCVPTHRRPIAYVPQSYGLWGTMTALQTVAFPLEVAGTSRARARAHAREILRAIELTGLDYRKPAQLSGGQQQRVALGRALARVVCLSEAGHTPLILLDEPVAAMDQQLRSELHQLVRQYAQAYTASVMYVTHDLSLALALSDRVLLLGGGHCLQCGTPAEVVAAPASRAVTALLGLDTVFPVVAESVDGCEATVLTKSGERLRCVAPQGAGAEACGAAHLYVPPHCIRLRMCGTTGADRINHLQVTVESTAVLPQCTQVRLATTDGSVFTLHADSSSAAPLDIGSQLAVTWPVDAGRLLVS